MLTSVTPKNGTDDSTGRFRCVIVAVIGLNGHVLDRTIPVDRKAIEGVLNPITAKDMIVPPTGIVEACPMILLGSNKSEHSPKLDRAVVHDVGITTVYGVEYKVVPHSVTNKIEISKSKVS